VSAPDAVTPAGFESVLVSVMPIDGVSRELCMWVADTPERRSRGMMGATGFGEAEAMVFAQPAPSTGTFWMKNTVISLDIIFIGADGRILNIEANTVPYSEEPRRAAGLAAAVLELNGGRAAELGIVPGDKVAW